jgi:hypothetical protein
VEDAEVTVLEQPAKTPVQVDVVNQVAEYTVAYAA